MDDSVEGNAAFVRLFAINLVEMLTQFVLILVMW